MSTSQAATDYQYAVLSLQPTTQRWYRQKLEHFVDWCGEREVELEALRAAHVRQFLDELRTIPSSKTGRPLTSYTVHGYAQVVKGFLSWCVKEDIYGVSEKVVRRLELPKVDEKVIEVFTREQMKRLLLACRSEMGREMSERDQAIIRVLYSTGVRASELCGLTLDRTFLTPRTHTSGSWARDGRCVRWAWTCKGSITARVTTPRLVRLVCRRMRRRGCFSWSMPSVSSCSRAPSS